MAPKKQSAFYNYMIQRKNELESKGHLFPRGLYDVSNHVSKEWENMSVADKKKYETGNPSRQNADSLPVESVATAEERKKAEDGKGRKIARLVLSKSANRVANMVFVLIECNPWCIDYNGDWIPAEIGLLAFSLNAGVIDEFGTLIDPGTEVIKGLRSSFNNTRDELMLPNLPFTAPTDFLSLINTINLFMKKHTNALSPGYLFCRKERTEVIQSCLQWIMKQTDLKNSFDLFSFENLLMKLSIFNSDLKNLTSDFEAIILQPSTSQNNTSLFRKLKFGSPTGSIKFKDFAHVNSILESLLYAGNNHFGCFHHMKNSGGIHNCALAKLNRYAYYAIASLIDNFGIKERPSVHYPDSNMELEETNKRIEMLKQWGLSDIEYSSFQYPEERQESLHLESAKKAAKLPVTSTTYMDDLPLAMVAPIFRPRHLPTFRVLSIQSGAPQTDKI